MHPCSPRTGIVKFMFIRGMVYAANEKKREDARLAGKGQQQEQEQTADEVNAERKRRTRGLVGPGFSTW